MYYASRRAARVGVSVVLLRVIETRDHGQQWLGVADIMRAEAHEEANTMLATFAARSNGIAGITPECVIREGEVAEEILRLIEEDEDISVLVLAAGVGNEGPGPLVSSLGSTPGAFPIPVAIVPGHLTDEELDAMT
jgi:nucleotide-binding universal stress UspA family protein